MADNPSDRHPVELLAEEFARRCRQGENPSIDDYAAKYPQWAEDIRALFPSVQMMEQLKNKRDAPTIVRRPGAAAAIGGMKVTAESSNTATLEQLGDFKIIREVGRGGMGIVYEAEQVPLARRVALKVLPHYSMLDDTRLERFKREAKAAAQLHHTNIVPVFGNGDTDGLHYYVMQFIEGQALNAVLEGLRKKTAVPPTVPSPRSEKYYRWVAHVGVEVAEALNYAHSKGTLHRDIKPANIILDIQGAAWVADFGLAKLASHDDLTQTGDIIGTLQYMAPETVQNKGDGRSDVYSLALVLFELLTLRQPFGESSAVNMLREMDQRELSPPRSINPDVPRDLEKIVLKAGAHDPNQRYPSAGDLADDLRRFIDDRPVLARAVGPTERLLRWCRRNRAVAGLLAAVAASLMLALVAGWVGYVKTTDALARESQRRADAAAAQKRAEENVAMCLQAFEQIFNKLEPTGGPPQEGQVPFGRPDGRPYDPNRTLPPRAPPKESKENLGMLQSVLSFYDQFAEKNETDVSLQFEAAKAYSRVGDIQKQLGAVDKAIVAYRRAESTVEALLKHDSKNPEYLTFAGRMYEGFATGFQKQHNAVEAEKYFRRSVEIGRQLVALDNDNERNHMDLNHARLAMAEFLVLQERTKEAQPLVDNAVADLELNAKNLPRSRLLLATAYKGKSAVLGALGDADGASKFLQLSIQTAPPPPQNRDQRPGPNGPPEDDPGPDGPRRFPPPEDDDPNRPPPPNRPEREGDGPDNRPDGPPNRNNRPPPQNGADVNRPSR